MEATAEAFLAAAQNDNALAVEKDQTSDDDRSSSLSDLEDGPDFSNDQLITVQSTAIEDNDSEAETERLEDSPEKLITQKKLAISPSKLGQSMAVKEDAALDVFSDSAMTSPLPSDEGSLNDELEDDDPPQDISHNEKEDSSVLQSAKKRKRSLLPDPDDLDDRANGYLHKRARSLKSDGVDSSDESGEDDGLEREARHEAATGPEEGGRRGEHEDSDEDDEDHQQDVAMGDVALEVSEKKKENIRRTSRRNTGEREEQSPNHDTENLVEEFDASDEDEAAEGEEADDAEAIAKSEEEAAKRMAAMEALTALEKHFATLRDRLYDERIASINHDLAQLASSKPTYPELLKQIEGVEKYRDEKFDIEQKLLLFRVGALKRKSVAERSQIHSAYFQTVRDLRETHLERVSERFYRIQRDRFKTENKMPDFTIPFPEKRSVQISQQTAYNKEVSILSGVAKYVGFPAAPDLPNAQQKELEQDLEKMGISAAQLRISKQARKAPALTNAISAFTSSISQPGAEEQFLEQTPWANPHHPVHRHRLQMSRQASNQSPSNESLITPAQQQRPVDKGVPSGSASTIVENPSAQASSALNTPYAEQVEPRNGGVLQPNYRLHSSSPFDTRRANPATMSIHSIGRNSPPPQAAASSPLAARAAIAASPPRKAATQIDRAPRHDTASPIRNEQIRKGSRYHHRCRNEQVQRAMTFGAQEFYDIFSIARSLLLL